ncbi:MAG: hypothetical protein AAGI70_02330 [Pseudomonadota bacterium]
MSEFGLMCFIALADWEELIPQAVRRALRFTAPGTAVSVREHPAEPGQSALLISIDRQDFLAVVMPGPIPQPDYDQAVQNSLFWPDAAAEMAGHRAFCVITALEAESAHGLVRAQAIALTRIAAAIAEALPSLGLYWRGAEGAVPPSRLLRAPAEITAGKWPADIWIGYVFYGRDTREDPMIGVQTRGAAAYLGFEVEVPPMPVSPDDTKEPLRVLFAAMGYLIAMGANIRDGQHVQVKGEKRTEWRLYQGRGDGPGLAQLTALDGFGR